MENSDKRYSVLKVSGSRYLYVNDHDEQKTIERFSLMDFDAQGRADRLASRLNLVHEERKKMEAMQ